MSMDYWFKRLSEYVRGGMGYFSISDDYRPTLKLDHWLQRRICRCYWKQWCGVVHNHIRQLT